MDSLVKLSPSELTFLWDECPRCFYLHVVRKFRRPWGAFPKIFTRIDKLMKDYFKNSLSDEISPDLPAGRVLYGEKWVTSAPITLPGHSVSCYIKGKFDTVVEFSDASYGVIDFKTSEPKPEHVPFYSRQLHAYAFALEHPAPNAMALNPVSRLGLLCVEPVNMKKTREDQVAYIGQATWLDCPKDEVGFLAFLDGVLGILEAPEPPPQNPNCGYCNYRQAARESGL
jgi:hypothetical protein